MMRTLLLPALLCHRPARDRRCPRRAGRRRHRRPRHRPMAARNPAPRRHLGRRHARPSLRRAPDQHQRRARARRAVGRWRQRGHRRNRATLAGRLRARALAEHGDRAAGASRWTTSRSSSSPTCPIRMRRARGGRDNVGVVGIAVFREARPVAYDDVRRRPPWRTRASPRERGAAKAGGALGAIARATPPPNRIRRAATSASAPATAQREWAPCQPHRVRARERARRRRSCSCATTTTTRWWRWASCRGRIRRIGIDAPRAFPNGFVADPPRW